VRIVSALFVAAYWKVTGEPKIDVQLGVAYVYIGNDVRMVSVPNLEIPRVAHALLRPELNARLR
jgi:hypothetical protein